MAPQTDKTDRPVESKPQITLRASDNLPRWLQERQVSLAFTTGRAGKLMLVGCNTAGRLVLTERTLPGCTVLWSDGQSLWVAAALQLWRFENALEPGQIQQGFDRMFIPQTAYTTGDLGLGSLTRSADGRPLFTSARFSCLAAPSATHHFVPLWRPPFISGLAPENRCQLTGLAIENNRPRYFTAAAETDEADGWRSRPGQGGIFDAADNRWVLRNLHLPLAVGLHQERLWVLDSGTGRLGVADPAAGAFETCCQCDGFPQAFAFNEDWAAVAISRPPGKLAGTGHLAGRLADEDSPHVCGIDIVDLRSGQCSDWLRIEGDAVKSIPGVALLPRVQCPQLVGLHSEAMAHIFSIAPAPSLPSAAPQNRPDTIAKTPA